MITNKFEEIQNYFESPLISQSFLKNFLKDQPRSLFRSVDKTLYYEEKKHYVIGSLIDFLTTMKEEQLNDIYYVDTYTDKPSEKIASIIHQIYDEQTEFNFENIVEICRLQEYQNGWKDETVYNKIIEHQGYYDNLLLAEGKQIISKEEWDLSNVAANAINTCVYTSALISNEHNLFQEAIYDEELNYRCLIDILYLNHEKKQFRVIDIKSTNEYLESFDVFKFRYDFQMAFYNDIVQRKYPDYTSYNPIIIAVSKKEPEYAEPFKLSSETLELGRNGGELRGRRERGYQQCVDSYNFYLKNNTMYNQELTQLGLNLVTPK